jgi:DNA-binding CsgD family transcriptional regulator/tetratricopeptide (TPR) repeat protein
VPKGVREVIGTRLNRLTPHCLNVMQNSAVIGKEFRVDLLCRLLDGMPEEQCLAAVEEARTASLIDESADPGVFQFTHALVRETLYDELPATRRALLHRTIAESMELQYADDLTPCLSALAHHYHAAGRAGDAAKTIEYATRAAERATAMQAHEEAVRHYRRAYALLPPNATTAVQRVGLLLGWGSAQNSAGDSAGALATFADAAECARRLGHASLLARAALGFCNAQERQGSEGAKAVALTQEALALAASTDDREGVMLLSALCRALLFSNRPDEAECVFREAVAIARRIGDPLTLCGALSAIAPGRWFPERLALRIEAAREALELVQREPRLDWPVTGLTGWYAGDLMESGDTAAAMAATRFHLVIGQKKREPLIEAGALALLAMIATHEGRFAEAEELAVQALRCGERFDRANAAGIFGVQMFTLRRHQGRLGELAPVLRQFQDTQGSAATWRPGLAVLHCELGLRDAARAGFEMLAVDGFAGIARDAIRIGTLAYLAEVCVWLGDRERAATLFDLLLPYAERNVVFGAQTASFGAAARLLGMLAATLERWDEAEHHFEYALHFDARTGARPWLAQSRCAYGAMLVRRGRPDDSEHALTLFEDALGDAGELGMRALEERVLALQPQAMKGCNPRSRATGLSAREVQVLQLVAAGKTNQEIATILCRSPNTVAIHVRNILGKTQAANRAEAAAFALRNGLLHSQ